MPTYEEFMKDLDKRIAGEVMIEKYKNKVKHFERSATSKGVDLMCMHNLSPDVRRDMLLLLDRALLHTRNLALMIANRDHAPHNIVTTIAFAAELALKLMEEEKESKKGDTDEL